MMLLSSSSKKKADTTALAKEKLAVAIPLSSSVQKKKKMVAVFDQSDWSTDDICLSFLHSTSAYSDFDLQATEVGKLLWPEDKDRFDDLGPANAIKYGIAHVFQSMQTLLFLSKKMDELCGQVCELGGQVKALKAEKVALQAENTKLKSAKLEADKVVAELHKQRDVDAGRLKAALSEIESLNTDIGDRLDMAALGAEIKLWAKMVEDFQNGLASTWNVEKIFAARDELEQITTSEAIPTEDLDGILGDMVSADRAQDVQKACGTDKE